jgi:hypothetical protein
MAASSVGTWAASDQHVVVALVVAAPGSVGVGHKGGDLAYEPVGFGQREPGGDRPVVIDQAGIRGVAPGLAEAEIAEWMANRSPGRSALGDRGERLVDGGFIGQVVEDAADRDHGIGRGQRIAGKHQHANVLSGGAHAQPRRLTKSLMTAASAARPARSRLRLRRPPDKAADARHCELSALRARRGGQPMRKAASTTNPSVEYRAI